jgi:hypothetical protein
MVVSLNGLVAKKNSLTVNRQSLCYSGSDSELSSVVIRLPAENDVSAEAKEPSLSEAVTRERLVKTQQARKDLVCVVGDL